MLLWKFFLVALLLTLTQQQCQPQFILPNTLQDAVELTTFTPQQMQTVASYTYKYNSNIFAQTPTALLSIGTFNLQNYAQINYLLTSAVQNNSLVIKVQSTNMNWQMLRVHFILHSRNDLYSELQTHNVIENVKSAVQCSSQPVGGSGSTVYFHQILGIKGTYTSTYDFRIAPVDLASGKCQYELQANTNTTFTVQTIGVDLQANSLAFDYQVVTWTSGSFSQQLWFDLAPAIYMLVGVSRLQFSGQALNIQTSFDVSNTLFTIMGSQEVTSLSMLIFSIGKLPSEVCAPCGNFISVGGCLDQCPANSYPSLLSNNGKVCRPCPRQLSQSLQGDTCSCPSGQTYFEGNCYSSSQLPPNCTSNQLLINKKCVNKNILVSLNCPANSSPNADHTGCRCNSGYESINNECLKLCPEHSKRTSYGICACNYGFIMNSSQLCESICPNNSVWRTDLNQCRCNANYEMVKGVCSQCPKGQVYEPSTGSCLVVYNAVNNNAESLVNIVNPNQNTCQKHQIYQNGQCVCDSVSIDSNGVCYPCPSFTFKNGNTCLSCPAYCQSCQSSSTCLNCQAGFDLIGNVCQEKCGDGRRFVVECDDGNLRNGDGCSSTCRTQAGYLCTGGSAISTDVCQPISGNGQTLSISISQGYPRYISSGILTSFIVNPPVVRSQSQLDALFNIQFPNPLSTPNTIYLSQSPNDPASISCFFLYHNDLPNMAFSVTFNIYEPGRGSSTLTWLFDTLSNGITSAIQRSNPSTDIIT